MQRVKLCFTSRIDSSVDIENGIRQIAGDVGEDVETLTADIEAAKEGETRTGIQLVEPMKLRRGNIDWIADGTEGSGIMSNKTADFSGFTRKGGGKGRGTTKVGTFNHGTVKIFSDAPTFEHRRSETAVR